MPCLSTPMKKSRPVRCASSASGWTKPIIGETTLTGQKVIELAGDAANGALAHVGLTVDAPQFKSFGTKYQQEHKSISDHNGIKGYTGVYVLKAAIEKAGKLDNKAVAAALKNASFSAKRRPGILLDVSFDDKGDIGARASWSRSRLAARSWSTPCLRWPRNKPGAAGRERAMARPTLFGTPAIPAGQSTGTP